MKPPVKMPYPPPQGIFDDPKPSWKIVDFGKFEGKGKSLPQTLMADPDWFFWAVKSDAFPADLRDQARKLNRLARRIRIPGKHADKKCVCWWRAPDGTFARIEIISKKQPPHTGSSSESRSDHLDMSVLRGSKAYDKRGYRAMVRNIREIWFGGRYITKRRCEAFFDDHRNFIED